MLTAEVKAKLVAAGLTTGYEVLRNAMPATPNKVIALFDSGGFAPEHFMGASPIEEPGLQVRVRGEVKDSEGPDTTIKAIFAALIDYGAFEILGARYLGFTALQSPYLLRRDESQRVEFAVNFIVHKEL